MSFAGGRGRGRGLGRGNTNTNGNVNGAKPWSNTPWAQQTPQNNQKPVVKKPLQPKVENEEKGKNNDDHVMMREKMVEMAAKYSSMLESDESSEEEIHDDEIISNTIKQYQETLADGEENKENQMLMDVLQSGAITCLVCIDNVKRLDAIWSCGKCSCILHLQCIQKWAREGVGQHKIKHEGDLKDLHNLTWQCPKCRHEYQQADCPTQYFCFCKKVANPSFDPWIVPHSCGQQCKKGLIPTCGHECLLLCHPGPCPPCPKTINSKCYCGRKGPLLKRCSNKKWSCGKPCGQRLSCGHHNCEQFCHEGDCPPCPYTSQQVCLCGKNKSERPCAQPTWTCKQACSKPYSCGHHICERDCHDGECGECPRSGKRSCPCGKTVSRQPCTEDVPTCQDTCLLPMECGIHQCAKRCHYGPCDTCLQVVDKTCRCRRRTKKIPCSQIFTCDFKCNNMRNCGRHQCKKKCCDGNCPPCEQVCNRNLNCRNHKCPSPCHEGLCYPCTLSTQVKCFCGTAKISVPCGKEKITKPPRCKLSCRIPPDCHHEKRIPHKCHYKRCPACKQRCSNQYTTCEHQCVEVCHDRIFNARAKEMDMLRNNPNKKINEDIYFQPLPCPPCKAPINKLCFGEHGTRSIPCSELKPYSCGEPCGRVLECTNHVCLRECHIVKGSPPEGMAGKNCRSCEEHCLKPRPPGCIHDCSLPCHSGECQPCNVHLKIDCHCRSIQMFLKCCDYNSADHATKDTMLCCKSRCPITLSCGHLCSKMCHRDICTKVEECAETKKVRCACGRRRKEVACVEVREGTAKVDCDERCAELKEKKKREKLDKEELEKAAEEKKHMEEVEKFERKKQGRKRKQKKVNETEEGETFFQKYGKYIFMSLVVLVISLVVAYVMNQN